MDISSQVTCEQISQGVRRQEQDTAYTFANFHDFTLEEKDVLNSTWAREGSDRVRSSSGFSQELYFLHNCW